ncbi:sensor histidine kinase [Streptomyces olivochromogenes]|uniref:sensor histidine kinase n=1 Tax=Streptomyces olivochromogenes TaxID=1963 RepID=UPI001F2B2106|nr:histidine kinase [Streptomyces olivochromogenes]MCF3132077.1 hypothetical protein [Streptomyces olivochromogenes]
MWTRVRAPVLAWWAVLLAGLGLGLATVRIATEAPGYGLAEAGAPVVVELLAGWGLMLAGLFSVVRRPRASFGPLLVAAGFAWFLVEWNSAVVSSSVAFTVGLALYAACPPMVGHALLVYPDRRLPGVDTVVAGVGYLTTVGALGVLPALVFDPAAQGCSACATNLLMVVDGPFATVNRIGVGLAGAGVALSALWCGGRLVRASAVLRRRSGPVVVPGLVYLVLVVADYGHALGRGYVSNDPVDRGLWLGQAAALVAVAAGACWEWQRARRTRTKLARLVIEVGRTPQAGGLVGVLAELLGDPSLAVLYPVSDGRQVDVDGRAVAVDTGREVTRLVRRGAVAASLVHRPGLLEGVGSADDIARTVQLALENERLRAETRAQLADLRESRARIVALRAAERRRLERDLHDGAQQRLVALALAIRLATLRADDQDLADRLTRAESQVQAALADLRALAHGLYPAALAEEGLEAALDVLAEGAAVPVTVATTATGRCAPAVELAGYLVVATAVGHSGCRRADVRVDDADGGLVVEVETDAGPPGELGRVQDRVGALDGRLTLAGTPDGGTLIRVELPCAS